MQKKILLKIFFSIFFVFIFWDYHQKKLKLNVFIIFFR